MSVLTHESIAWRTNVEGARHEGFGSGRGVFIELFSPKCWGCQNMESRTFADHRVTDYLMDGFVPVHYDVLAQPGRMDEFNAYWTPTLIFQDNHGHEIRRATGFLDPDRFMGEVALARVACALKAGEYSFAHRLAQDAVSDTTGDDLRHGEALYWQAVAAYKASGNQELLIQGWQELNRRLPDSEWAARCDFIREL